MFNFFTKKKEDQDIVNNDESFDIELVAYALAYEIAIADGGIDESELSRIRLGLEKIALKLNKSIDDLFEEIEEHNKNSVSFYEFIEDINSNFN